MQQLDGTADRDQGISTIRGKISEINEPQKDHTVKLLDLSKKK